MSRGLTNLYTSRRTNFILCKYWSQEESEIASKSELLYKDMPTGYFYASESNSYATRNNIVNGDFIFDANFINLKTADDVSKLKVNDKVWMDDNTWWIVEDVQKTPIKKNRGYMRARHCSAEYYISLRR